MTLILQIPAAIQKLKHHPDIWTLWSSWIKLLRCCIRIYQVYYWYCNWANIAHNNQKFRHSLRPQFFFLFFFYSLRGHGRRKILMDSHFYGHETSIFTLGAPHEEVQGRQTKLHPGFRAVDIIYFHFSHFFTKIKIWHLLKKNYQKGPQHACSTYLFKHLLQ